VRCATRSARRIRTPPETPGDERRKQPDTQTRRGRDDAACPEELRLEGQLAFATVQDHAAMDTIVNEDSEGDGDSLYGRVHATQSLRLEVEGTGVRCGGGSFLDARGRALSGGVQQIVRVPRCVLSNLERSLQASPVIFAICSRSLETKPP
jgi:hypothetical protein